MKKKVKKKSRKLQPTDGLGPKEIKNIRNALRLVWQRSHAWKLVKRRSTGTDGFYYCEKCHKRTPQLKVDHLNACGNVNGGYIKRLMVPSNKLQGLCKKCHDAKTKIERSTSNKKTGSNKYGF